MKTFRGYMKNEGKKTYIYFIIAAVLFVALSGNIYNSIQSYKYRGLCDQYRNEINRAEEANRELADRFGRITEVVGQLHETTERNVTDSRDIIETIEILRNQIQELEDCCGMFDQSEYYKCYDSYYRDEGLMQ